MKLIQVALCGIAILFAGCGGGSSNANDASGPTGSGGAVSGTGGQATGSGGTPMGGQSGSGGAAGSGGTTTDARDAAVTDTSPGDTGGPTDGGAGDGSAPAAWACPPGPFPMPMAGPAQTVCGTFTFKYGWSEGPTWVASQNAFFFSNFVISASGPGDMIKYTPGGQCETFIVGNGCNGLAVTPAGKIVGACHTPRAIVEYDLATKQSRTVLDMFMGRMLDSPNDLIVHSNGTIYFTNPIFELGGRPQGYGPAAIRIDPNGVPSLIAQGGVNGIALSPDEKRLYVVGMGAWDLDAAGVPSNRSTFALGSDGIAVDCAGNIYDNAGTIRNPQGQVIGNFPGGTNMAFGGPDGKTLLVVSNRTARTVQMNIPGRP